MKDSVVSESIISPYSQALLSLGESAQVADQFGEDAAYIIELLSTSEELSQFLASPIGSLEAKKGVLRQLLTDKVHPSMLNFALLLVDRGRIPFLGGVCRQYQTLLRQKNQSVLAEVTSVVPLSEAQQDEIRQKVLAMTDARQVELSTSLDPSLIGGVIIQVGSQVIDASLRGQLRRISLLLSSAA
ncbi:MAG: ATP synthase F1 subunit delta [Cyanobacteria bacterium P01_A01_bin.114]